MANTYQPGTRVIIRDGNVTTTLIDQNNIKHFIDVPDGNTGFVRQEVLGGGIYIVQTTVIKDHVPITGIGIFIESVLYRD